MIASIRRFTWFLPFPVAGLLAPLVGEATMPPRSSQLPAEVARAFDEGLFGLPETPSGLGASSATGAWRLPVILVSFADSALTHSSAQFNRTLFDSTGATGTGSVFDYYRWASRGALAVTGRVVATVTLPSPRAHYGGASWGLNPTGTGNAFGAVRDGLRAAPAGIRWSDFDRDRDGYVDMLWVIHAGIGGEASQSRDDLWSITSAMTAGWSEGAPYETDEPVPGSPTRRMRIDRFTILPELSAFVPGAISEIGVYCHEFGHAIGLPDLYDTGTRPPDAPSNAGPGNWSLMASGAYGGDGRSPQSPSHLGAWPLRFLGWDRSFRPTRDTTVVLEPVVRGGRIMEWWFQGERNPEHFLVENRRREGFDRSLLADGLLIYHVDEAVISQRLRSNAINSGPSPGLWLVEADGNIDLVVGINRADANDPFPGGLNRTAIDDDTPANTRTFAGAFTNIALRDITPTGDDVRFAAHVRARGWLPPADFTGPGFQPLRTNAAARASGVDDRGRAHWVTSEVRSGVPQIVLRSGDDRWGEPFQVSHSPRGALDPTLAVLPGGDLAIVWADTRGGRSQLYYRSRVLDAWTPERLILDWPGDCRNPAIGVDRRGVIFLAFQHVHFSGPRLHAMRFPYYSPFGQPVRLTDDLHNPGSPAVAVDPDGFAFVLWPERAAPIQRILFSRFHPDSGPSPPQALTRPPANPQDAPSAVVDRLGTLHAVWHVSGPGLSQLRFQSRPRSEPPSPADTLLETQSGGVQNPVLVFEPPAVMHLVHEASFTGGVQTRYKRWEERRGWDAVSTEVTLAGDGDATSPQALPRRAGRLAVAYVGFPGGSPRFMVRERHLSAMPPVADVRPRPAPSGLTLGPNPLPRGEALALSWSGPAAGAVPRVDLYDLAGRRLAVVALRADGARWRGMVPSEVTRLWGPGVYFVRPRGSGEAATRLVVLR